MIDKGDVEQCYRCGGFASDDNRLDEIKKLKLIIKALKIEMEACSRACGTLLTEQAVYSNSLKWYPMAIAPRDNTKLVVYHRNAYHIVTWNKQLKEYITIKNKTIFEFDEAYWVPLPPLNRRAGILQDTDKEGDK